MRGVGLEFRKMAKAAAASGGMTLGRWMELTIALGAGVSEPEKKSPETGRPTIREVVEGKAVPLLSPAEAPLNEEELVAAASNPVEKEEKPAGRKPRVVCQHGTERGYNCWQCGGLARTGA